MRTLQLQSLTSASTSTSNLVADNSACSNSLMLYVAKDTDRRISEMQLSIELSIIQTRVSSIAFSVSVFTH